MGKKRESRDRAVEARMAATYIVVAKEEKEALRDQQKEPLDAGKEKVEEEEDGPMSLLRKAAFISSIVFSVLLCVVFLWVLPCDLATCSPSTNSTHSIGLTHSTDPVTPTATAGPPSVEM